MFVTEIQTFFSAWQFLWSCIAIGKYHFLDLIRNQNYGTWYLLVFLHSDICETHFDFSWFENQQNVSSLYYHLYFIVNMHIMKSIYLFIISKEIVMLFNLLWVVTSSFVSSTFTTVFKWKKHTLISWPSITH